MYKVLKESDYFKENEDIYAYFSPQSRKLDLHAHTFWELAYIYEGQGVHHIVSRKDNVSAGSIVLIKPGTYHDFVNSSDENGSVMWACNLLITTSKFNKIIKKVSQISDIKLLNMYQSIKNDDFKFFLTKDSYSYHLQKVLWTIVHEHNHHTVGSDVIIENSLINLFIALIRQYEYTSNNFVDVVTEDYALDDLLKFIESNYGGELTLDMLAGMMHFSREYLCRYFKKKTGETLFEYIGKIRISHAKIMLLDSNRPVSAIANYCGYPNVNNFRKAFAKATGMSPTDYRKFHGNNSIS